MVVAYCRCNSGHYFLGETCPLDGWSSSESQQLTEVVERIAKTGHELSLAELRKAGAREETLARTIVIEFGDGASVFEAIAPEGYVVGGKWKLLRDLGAHFTI